MISCKDTDKNYRQVKTELYDWANKAHDELGMPYVILEDILKVLLTQVDELSSASVDSYEDVQNEESELEENESE